MPNTDEKLPGPTPAEVIRAACAERGVSRNELARRLGVLPHRVTAIFRQSDMTVALYRRCLRAVGFDLDVVERMHEHHGDGRCFGYHCSAGDAEHEDGCPGGC